MGGGGIDAHGDADFGIPEVGVGGGGPATAYDADEAVGALGGGLVAVGGEDEDFCVAEMEAGAAVRARAISAARSGMR